MATKKKTTKKKATKKTAKKTAVKKVAKKASADPTPPTLLQKQPTPPSVVDAGSNADTAREQARAERARVKQIASQAAEKEERQRKKRIAEEERLAQRERANKNGGPSKSPAPISIAAKRAEKNRLKGAESQEVVYLDMEELQKYKMEALEARRQKEVDRVKTPIIKRIQEETRNIIQNAVNSDEKVNDATRESINYTNEVIQSFADKLPEGYAITLVDPENGRIKAEYAPAQVGKLIPVPEKA